MAEDPREDDDEELELEPVDPEIIELQRQRTERHSRDAEAAVDLDDVYREREQEDPLTLETFQDFRFTTRHLLMATAVLALVMTLFELGECGGLFFGGIIALAVAWFLVMQKERREERERQQRREEVEARIAAQRSGEEPERTLPQNLDLDTVWKASQGKPEFSFSLKQLLGAVTGSAVFFALVHLVGGPHFAALLLGAIALVGIVVYALGYDPPHLAVFAWWVLMVLYIAMSIWAAFSPSA